MRRLTLVIMSVVILASAALALDDDSFVPFYKEFVKAVEEDNAEFVLENIDFPLPVWQEIFSYSYETEGWILLENSRPELKAYTKNEFAETVSCNYDLENDPDFSLPKAPQWKCVLFFKDFTRINRVDMVVKESSFTSIVETKGFDPHKPKDGTRFNFALFENVWKLQSIESMNYMP